MLGLTLRWTSLGVENSRNTGLNKLRPDGPLAGSYADFITYLLALKKKIQRDYLVLLFCNTETTAGLPVLKGIFFKLFTAQTRLGFTASNKHCVADPETSKT